MLLQLYHFGKIQVFLTAGCAHTAVAHCIASCGFPSFLLVCLAHHILFSFSGMCPVQKLCVKCEVVQTVSSMHIQTHVVAYT